MSRKISLLLLALFSFVLNGFAHADASEANSVADVSVTARIEQVDPQRLELVVTAEIADGLHVYAQTQPKPFLATKIKVLPTSQGFRSVGEFKADRDPIVIRHESLQVALHEFEGTVQWRAPIDLGDSTLPIKIEGTVFAQACEAERCFAPQTYSFSADRDVRLVAESSPQDAAGSLMIAKDPTSSESVAVAEVTASAPKFSLDQLQVETTDSQSAWSVIPFAFIAGFLLNFMPCVLPVVGLKLLSFVQQANSDRKRILLMNVAYTGGLLSVMMVLASLAVFAGLGWGEQFSSAGFTVTLSAIVFAFGLSFLGVWEIPIPGFIGSAGGKTKQEGYGGAFSKGILSTLLATPCSGPFLGAALAWAVKQPSYLTYGVFAAVGIGMASPYLVVGLFPSTIRFLPKPGNWMVTFKQTMGFVMLATVVYLMSFMPVASVVPTVLLLLGVGLAVWYGARTPLYAPAGEQIKAWSIATSLVVLTAIVSFGWFQGVMQSRFERAAVRLLDKGAADVQLASFRQNDSTSIAWQTYSPELLESLIQQGKPVFVDFTADWCLTCKSNESAAIETEQVAQAIRDSGTIALRADKTEPNPAVDDLLRKLGNSAASIPFYAVFPADHPGQPILLDGIYAAPGPFVEALQAAGPSADKSALQPFAK